jgi:hypothetical protein
MSLEYVRVAEVVLVKDGDNFVGAELGFGTNVNNKDGAALVLNMLGDAMRNVTWTFNTLMRVADAQTNAQADGSGDTDTETPAGEGDAADPAGTESIN